VVPDDSEEGTNKPFSHYLEEADSAVRETSCFPEASAHKKVSFRKSEQSEEDDEEKVEFEYKSDTKVSGDSERSPFKSISPRRRRFCKKKKGKKNQPTRH